VRSISDRALKVAVGATVALGSVVLMGAAAFAQTTPPADPTGGAASDIQAQTTGWVTSYGVPLIVALLVLGLVVSILIKFARRGARAA
jgi:hypothetical protein